MILDPLGDDGGTDVGGELHNGVHEGSAGGVAMGSADEGAVELDEVGSQLEDLPQVGVAGPPSSTASRAPVARNRSRTATSCW